MPYVTSKKKANTKGLYHSALPSDEHFTWPGLGEAQGFTSDGIGGGCTFQALCSGGSAQDSSKYHVAWPVGDWTA